MPRNKTNPKEESPDVPQREGVVPMNITSEIRESFLAYSMSVITSRALPDVRDGLKPVHRRILYSLHENGLSASAKFRKSAFIVGDVLGKYHPHGDTSVYDSMVNMAQDFSYRYPLVWGQGNLGSIDGDAAAAMRYTEAKMSRISGELLRDIDKNTVDFRPNYDETRNEPVVLPTVVPNLLLNGTLGIAVGMATNIPPHNLGEVVDACITLINDPKATNEDLLEFVKGPDFPTGGVIYGKKDIMQAYTTGRGGIVTRGEASISDGARGTSQIIITSIPYRVNKSALIMKIAELKMEKKLEGIKELRDESTTDIRIVIELKTGAHPQKVLNFLYKHTDLEQNFNVNMVALVDGIPQTLSLRDFLTAFLDHRMVVVRRRSEFDLAKAKAREHILEGLTKALDHIDEIIKLIKASADVTVARENLMKKFKFSEIQANAILEMKLQKLAGLERKKIEEELNEVRKTIAFLEDLLKSTKKMLGVIKDELVEIREKYADERRTKVVKTAVGNLSDEDLIADTPSVLVYTADQYIKRVDPSEFKTQKRGGVGVSDNSMKEEDIITHILTASTHSDLLFFTDRGKVYQIKMFELPEGKRTTRGKSIRNFLGLSDTERVTSILAMPKNIKESSKNMLLGTKFGVMKKVAIDSFKQVRTSGIIAISLDTGDELLGAHFVDKNDTVLLVSAEGQSIRFDESDIRVMGRTAGGVRALKLDKGDYVVGMNVAAKDASEKTTVLVLAQNGYGKQTEIGEYKIQNRGGSGIKVMQVTDKTGLVVGVQIVGSETELIAISQKGQVIRTELKAIPVLSRATQGVRVMRLREDGDKLASYTLVE